MRAINRLPGRGTALVLGLLPFVALSLAYLVGSAVRLAANPSDKLLPSLATIAATVDRMAFQPDPRTGDYLLWVDTAASLSRLGWGLGIAAGLALVVGVLIGLLPLVRATLAPFVAFVSMVPPLALLPILFIVMAWARHRRSR